ncbi:MAG: hypothetical protein ACYCYM_07825 [Saccharofermentanales bacterium]
MMVDLNEVGFGFYGVGESVNPEVYQKILKSDSVNVMFAYGNAEQLVEQTRKIRDHGKTCWLSVFDSVFVRDPESGRTVIRSDYKENLTLIAKSLSDAGVYDIVRGIYFDEPFLNKVSKEGLCEISSFYRSLDGNKGVFICFCVAPICPDVWSPDYPIDLLDEQTCRCITDMAFDIYWDYTENKHIYQKITDKMYELTKNIDTKYWFVPMTMSYLGQSDEDGSIIHTNALFELLKQSRNPGGLMCYSYWTIPAEIENLGNINLDILFDKKNPDRWTRLEKRLLEIGSSIIAGDLKK